MSDSRSISTATQAAAQADHVRLVTLMDLDYPDGPVRVCSLQGNLVVGGNTYYGMGAAGELSAVTEGAENKSYGITASLTGVPNSFAKYLIGQDVQGRSATIRLGLLSPSDKLIGDWVTIFVGRMDAQDIQVGATTAVTVSIESLLIDWERARVRRYTDVDQQTAYPGDRGLEYISALQNLTLKWGK